MIVVACVLQRYARKPQAQHARDLNQWLTWIQSKPWQLMYRAMTNSTPKSGSPSHLRVVSDAAYKKETVDGYSLRGAPF
eukprot:7435868-Lingulodinium_polyedra.AAC.1